MVEIKNSLKNFLSYVGKKRIAINIFKKAA